MLTGEATRRIDPSTIDADRFWSKVNITDPGSCWLWTAGTFNDGYGQFAHDNSSYGAHRVAWALATNACLLPPWVIRHDCDTPPCCNPTHLQPGSVAQNAADMVERGRTLAGDRHPKRQRPELILRGPDAPAWRDQCRRDHDPIHRYLTKAGVRRCRECDRIAARAGYRRRSTA